MITDITTETETWIQGIENTTSYQEAKIAFMMAELTFGECEDACHGMGDQSERIAELDACWDKIALAFEQHIVRLAKVDELLKRLISTPPLKIEYDLKDNYLHGAVAAVLGSLKGVEECRHASTFVAAATYNKHLYEGFRDEIACLRYMLSRGLSGQSVNSESGYSALQYMSCLTTSAISHPRAVRLLLKAGASVDTRNRGGDTPLIVASANPWFNENLYRTISLLLDAGADPHLESNDGASAYKILTTARLEVGQHYVDRLVKRLQGQAAA